MLPIKGAKYALGEVVLVAYHRLAADHANSPYPLPRKYKNFHLCRVIGILRAGIEPIGHDSVFKWEAKVTWDTRKQEFPGLTDTYNEHYWHPKPVYVLEYTGSDGIKRLGVRSEHYVMRISDRNKKTTTKRTIKQALMAAIFLGLDLRTIRDGFFRDSVKGKPPQDAAASHEAVAVSA